MTTREVAERLRVGTQTVRRWVAAGTLHAIQPGGDRGHIRIPLATIEAMENGHTSASADALARTHTAPDRSEMPLSAR
jgi:excisionase family DNA binding protein